MASKTVTFTALLLSLNLLFFTMVSSTSPACSSSPAHKSTPQYSPVPKTPSPNHSNVNCPIDTLKLGLCKKIKKIKNEKVAQANVLGLVKVKIGSPPTLPCCSLLQGLADLEAAACLCTAIKANVLGINLNVPVALSIILNNCGKNDSAFQCA